MFKISNHYVSKIVFVLLFIEALILLGAAYAGASLRFLDMDAPISTPHVEHFLTSAIAFVSEAAEVAP